MRLIDAGFAKEHKSIHELEGNWQENGAALCDTVCSTTREQNGFLGTLDRVHLVSYATAFPVVFMYLCV